MHIDMRHKGILAIDFDDTIAETNFPEIIRLKPFAKESINKLYAQGWFIIINTCRSSIHESAAIAYLKGNGIKYDLINQNHPGLIDLFVYDCRKISADIYIDDKNIDAVEYGIDWVSVYRTIQRVSGRIQRKGMLSLIPEIKSKDIERSDKLKESLAMVNDLNLHFHI